MKAKITALLFVAALFTGLLLFNQNKAVAQEIISGNLFQNPGWEDGYYNQDGIPQIAVPNGWRMHWLDGVTFAGSGDNVAYRPETVVWNIMDAPENERAVFFRDGSYTLKIFKSWSPVYAALSQDVSGLEVGRKYRIVAPIFIDLVEKYENGQKVPPYRNDSGFVRFGAGKLGAPWLDGSQINYSPYWTAENVNPFYQAMPIFIWDFVATEPNMTIFIEMGSNYPWSNNGFFMDGVGLFALDQKEGVVSSGGSGSGGGGGVAAPAGTPLPTSTPLPTPTPRADGSIVHIVGAGDTFWSIAIEYAPALGMTAEEALPVIMELNNNPAFISAGQELIIKEPDPNAAANAATAAESEATPEGETTEGEAIVVEGAAPAEAEATATPEASDTPAEETVIESTSGGVCLQVYEDINGNELYDNDEPLLPDAAVTLFRAGNTVTTYITDGVSEPHCIDNLEGGAYEIQVFPPANYRATTPDTWALAITNGVMVPVAFGVQEGAAEVAMVGTSDAAAEGDTAVAVSDTETPTEEANASSNSGGIMANIGLIVLGIAVVLVLLAGAGVILLRRA